MRQTWPLRMVNARASPAGITSSFSNVIALSGALGMRPIRSFGVVMGLHEPPNTFRREGQLPWLRAEAGERGGDRIRDDARDRADAAFAAALRAERVAGRRGMLEH